MIRSIQVSTSSSISTVLAAIVISASAYLGPAVTVAKAQSFSCANAQIPSEFTICNSEDLILLDEKLAGLFADARVSSENLSAVQKVSDSHGKWLRERNACRIDFGCLLQSYRDRIRMLQENGKSL